MGDFLARHRSALFAFLALVVPLFLLYVHGRSPRKTTVFEVVLMDVTGPVQGAAGKVLRGINDLWEGYIALVDLAEDNEKLRGEIETLEARANRVEQVELENAKLRQMLNFVKKRRELVTAGAHVIGKDVSSYTRVVRIALDIGGDHGITEGMPVINSHGLVGRIHRISGSFAEVLLVVDARSTVSVVVRDKGVTGTLEGTNSPYSYTARMLYLHRANPLVEGDVLVTSGHDKVFPPGITVGTIKSLQERQRDVEYELEVRPSVNFSVLDTVYVVIDVLDEPAPPLKDTTAAGGAR